MESLQAAIIIRSQGTRPMTWDSSRSSRYIAVPQLGSRSPLLQELLLRRIHYQSPSPRWLRYRPSEASCLLYRARRRVHSIAAISTGVWQLSSRSRGLPTSLVADDTSVTWHGRTCTINFLEFNSGRNTIFERLTRFGVHWIYHTSL